MHLERHHLSKYILLLKAEGDKVSEHTVLEQSNPLPKDSGHSVIACLCQWWTMLKIQATAEPRFKIPSRPYFTNTVILAMYTRMRVKTEKCCLLSSTVA